MDIGHQIIEGLKATTPVEAVAVTAGIVSVCLERAENIWLYPIGLINTCLYIYISFHGHLFGEASVNIFYTIISIYGWWLWSRRSRQQTPALQISFSDRRQWAFQVGFFVLCYIVLFAAVTGLKNSFYPGAIPWADALAAASAYTGMYLTARKKVECWWWWLITNFTSIPLYFVKGYAFTSVQFIVFFAVSVAGLIAWWRKGKANSRTAAVA